MRKTTSRKLKKFEQFEPEAEVQSEIDIERLDKLIDIVIPSLSEISMIISQEEDRSISIEYRNKIESILSDLDDLKTMYK